MKKIIIALLLVLIIATPSYALINQHPIKNLIRNIASLFRESPFAKQRRLIQKEYDDDKISKEDYDNRMDDVDRREEAAKQLKQQLIEQRRQAAAQQAAQ